VQYFNQTGVVRAADAAGLEFEDGLGLPEKLVVVQDLMAKGDERVVPVYETVGTWFGYALAHYADFYDVEQWPDPGPRHQRRRRPDHRRAGPHSPRGEFPELSDKITLHLPDEPTAAWAVSSGCEPAGDLSTPGVLVGRSHDQTWSRNFSSRPTPNWSS